MVLQALHEAARDVVAENDDEEIRGQGDKVSSAIWPAIVKFVGKGHSALLVANVLTRNAIWRLGGLCPTAVDSEARLLDARSATAKLMVHLVCQAYCEMLMHEVSSVEEVGNVVGHEGERCESILKNQLPVPGQQRDSAEVVARHILLTFCFHPGGVALLRDGPVHLKFANDKHKVLRQVRQALATSPAAWRLGLARLLNEGVIEAQCSETSVLRLSTSPEAFAPRLGAYVLRCTFETPRTRRCMLGI